MPEPLPSAELRRAKRLPAVRVLHCRVSVVPEEPDLPAIVFDLTADGVGLMVSRLIKFGQTFVIRLAEAGAGRPALELPARAIRARPLNPGWFSVGAEFFQPLIEQELSAILNRMGCSPRVVGKMSRDSSTVG
jgi:hypothetical protein